MSPRSSMSADPQWNRMFLTTRDRYVLIAVGAVVALITCSAILAFLSVYCTFICRVQKQRLASKPPRKTIALSTHTFVNTSSAATLNPEDMDLTQTYPELPASRRPLRFPWISTSSDSIVLPLPWMTTRHRYIHREPHEGKYPPDLATSKSLLNYWAVGLPRPVPLEGPRPKKTRIPISSDSLIKAVGARFKSLTDDGQVLYPKKLEGSLVTLPKKTAEAQFTLSRKNTLTIHGGQQELSSEKYNKLLTTEFGSSKETDGDGRKSDLSGESKGFSSKETDGDGRKSDLSGESKGFISKETDGDGRKSDLSGESKGLTTSDSKTQKQISDKTLTSELNFEAGVENDKKSTPSWKDRIAMTNFLKTFPLHCTVVDETIRLNPQFESLQKDCLHLEPSASNQTNCASVVMKNLEGFPQVALRTDFDETIEAVGHQESS
ncbi:unnamed protein product [Cyprideis torosa]|uniref:Uncharacterized protein n=1 Tax=Cyprideis torosa TaxID=163714 RepID=A0A7R8ZM53_9CRUS|nr:unnamed protein product [Cyprideis torosa]CAG0883564.1 unnamed protein product [Cyprideis torosa]